MDWRITFFVNDVMDTSDGLVVIGEQGLGPPQEGDEFSFVHHQDDGTEDAAVLRVVEVAPDRLRLVTERAVSLRAGDILGGEVDR